MSRADFCGSLQTHEHGLRCGLMAREQINRPVFHKELGDRLRKLREAHDWSVQQAINIAKGKQHRALTLNRLRWLEEGKTKFPDAEVLRAVADIYDLTYAELAKAFVAANYGRDLLRHDGEGTSNLPPVKGVFDVPASDREVIALRQRLGAFETLVGEMQHVTSRLFQLAALGEKGSEARRVARRGRHAPRKAG